MLLLEEEKEDEEEEGRKEGRKTSNSYLFKLKVFLADKVFLLFWQRLETAQAFLNPVACCAPRMFSQKHIIQASSRRAKILSVDSWGPQTWGVCYRSVSHLLVSKVLCGLLMPMVMQPKSTFWNPETTPTKSFQSLHLAFSHPSMQLMYRTCLVSIIHSWTWWCL